MILKNDYSLEQEFFNPELSADRQWVREASLWFFLEFEIFSD